MSYITHPAYQQQRQSPSYGNTGTVMGRINNVRDTIAEAARTTDLERKKFLLERAVQDGVDGLKLYGSKFGDTSEIKSLRGWVASAEGKLKDVKKLLNDTSEFKLVDIESEEYSWATGIDKKAKEKAEKAQVKKKSDMVALMGNLQDVYKSEKRKSIDLSSIASGLPAEATGAGIAKYAAAFKSAKSKLASSPKAQGALVTAASWFWENVEKPARKSGAVSSSGSGGGGGGGGKKSSSSGGVSANPYAYGMFEFRPFFRKNNVWMYGTAALLVGGAAWWFWPED